MQLKNIVENNETKSGRIFDFVIQFLIIISLISFTIETIPNLSNQTIFWLNLIEIICVTIFTIEYLLRLVFANKKYKFIFSFYGLIDLFAILPFYLSSGIDLRSIRIFRLFRLLRAFKLFRYSKALQRFNDAFNSVKAELFLFLVATLFLLYVSSVGIYYFENEAQPDKFSSIFHCLWWAGATLTTVGYGDVYPITIGGRIFTSFVVLIGIGIVAIPTGLIASALTKVVNEEK
ncbi:MAG: ion transporter [Ignavibacteriae bacterium]|nr:ion transporter [Ignavibacteriota bacterium]